MKISTIVNAGILLALALASTASASEHAEAAHEDEGSIVMNAAQRSAQGIDTARVASRVIAGSITAPGEVRLNGYLTAQVTTRIPAQVVARHVQLGEHVAAGDALLTLSSVEMATAQGALIEADREWSRVHKLGRGVIADTRYVAAEVARQRAYATVRAYGLTETQIQRLLAGGDALRATGEFDLLSPRDGTVIRDPFVIGELVEPGRVLYEISDESLPWVEAQLRPDQAGEVTVGATARISRDGNHWLEGRVIQFRHELDETTRTRGVRVEVPNPDHVLHAGDYVDVTLETRGAVARAAVPERAVLLMDGVPSVFRVEGDRIHPQAVEPGMTRGGWTEIVAGLAEGDEVVTRGAFLLKSLSLKSRMGEGHAH
ncbi:MAG: efflux RND transporter periplasmic adaptor subunit [Pseudomonadales bacterium]|jgi:cobalt-zinc-cadmium efflux system membrane fusion protein|nr:efflux RND transporter periplasmic adaptor subunit [Pseudomonadales bacterium]MCP5320822.1 efflux RND transporter periplasmic adaptor subunit [Pseudomonadales bacterium]MCP5337621.1 efflux RND transporter periplasmic adaptor subunit [Pseudomonadales bacterium]